MRLVHRQRERGARPAATSVRVSLRLLRGVGVALVCAGSIVGFGAAATGSGWQLSHSFGIVELVSPPTPPVVKAPPSVIKQAPVPLFPGICPLQATPSAVTVCWYDRSTDEQKFVVYKRDATGTWQAVYQVPTRDSAGVSGGDYQYVDTDLSVSGQCYMIGAVNAFGAGDTQEECTVRPAPSQFPQTVPPADKQWYGLSNVNDGTGDLFNGPRGRSLINAGQTFGVNLAWTDDTALWKIEAQGGPHLMYGQAVALRVWGGGWLTYGHETWGVDLVLSNEPAYQWYVVGEQPGNPIDNGEFALWNSAANRYLTSGYQTFGVSLNWASQPGTSTPSVYNASVMLTAQPPVSGYVPFLGYFGGGPGNTSILTQVSNPPNGATLYFIKPGDSSSDCGNSNDVITLGPGATLTGAQMQTLYGSAMPSLSQRIPFLVCAATQYSSVSINVQYRE